MLGAAGRGSESPHQLQKRRRVVFPPSFSFLRPAGCRYARCSRSGVRVPPPAPKKTKGSFPSVFFFSRPAGCRCARCSRSARSPPAPKNKTVEYYVSTVLFFYHGFRAEKNAFPFSAESSSPHSPHSIRQATRHCRARPYSLFTAKFPYFSSPRTGKPRCARCARI